MYLVWSTLITNYENWKTRSWESCFTIVKHVFSRCTLQILLTPEMLFLSHRYDQYFVLLSNDTFYIFRRASLFAGFYRLCFLLKTWWNVWWFVFNYWALVCTSKLISDTLFFLLVWMCTTLVTSCHIMTEPNITLKYEMTISAYLILFSFNVLAQVVLGFDRNGLHMQRLYTTQHLVLVLDYGLIEIYILKIKHTYTFSLFQKSKCKKGQYHFSSNDLAWRKADILIGWWEMDEELGKVCSSLFNLTTMN